MLFIKHFLSTRPSTRGLHIALRVTRANISSSSYHFHCFGNKKISPRRLKDWTNVSGVVWMTRRTGGRDPASHSGLLLSFQSLVLLTLWFSFPGSLFNTVVLWADGTLDSAPGTPRVLSIHCTCWPGAGLAGQSDYTPQEMQWPHGRDVSCRSYLTGQTEVAVKFPMGESWAVS